MWWLNISEAISHPVLDSLRLSDEFAEGENNLNTLFIPIYNQPFLRKFINNPSILMAYNRITWFYRDLFLYSLVPDMIQSYPPIFFASYK